MYNIRNGVIRRLVSTSIKIVLDYFCQLSPFSSYYILNDFQKLRDLEHIGQSHEYNIPIGAIQWLISTSIKVVVEHLSLALAVFYILYNMIFRNFVTLNNIGQGHDLQHSQWRHSMANINLYKSSTPYLSIFASSYRFPDILYYMILRNFVTLKIQAKVTLYKIRNGAIQ